MYETRQWQYYEKLAEWLAVKIAKTTELIPDKNMVQWIASELADAYNSGWNDGAKEMGKYRR